MGMPLVLLLKTKIIKVIRNCVLQTTTLCMKCNANPFGKCWNSSQNENFVFCWWTWKCQRFTKVPLIHRVDTMICTSMNTSQIIASERGKQCWVNADIMAFKVGECGCLAGNGRTVDAGRLLWSSLLEFSREIMTMRVERANVEVIPFCSAVIRHKEREVVSHNEFLPSDIKSQ